MKGAKDTLTACDEPGTIYAIGCKDCAHVYVGETARTAHQRGEEHKAHFRHGRDRLSAIAAHALEEGHDIHWQPRVIGKEQNPTKRRVKEAIFIDRVRRKGKAMNQDKGLELSPLWLDITHYPQ